jgi:hypothetical protein
MRRVVMEGMLRRFERLPGCHHLVVGQRHALHAPTNLFFLIIIYIYQNTKLPLNHPHCNKKKRMMNVRMPLKASFTKF